MPGKILQPFIVIDPVGRGVAKIHIERSWLGSIFILCIIDVLVAIRIIFRFVVRWFLDLFVIILQLHIVLELVLAITVSSSTLSFLPSLSRLGLLVRPP